MLSFCQFSSWFLYPPLTSSARPFCEALPASGLPLRRNCACHDSVAYVSDKLFPAHSRHPSRRSHLRMRLHATHPLSRCSACWLPRDHQESDAAGGRARAACADDVRGKRQSRTRDQLAEGLRARRPVRPTPLPRLRFEQPDPTSTEHCPQYVTSRSCLVAGTLSITSAQQSDEGKYECVAKNSVGVAYSYGANLYVRGEWECDIPDRAQASLPPVCFT